MWSLGAQRAKVEGGPQGRKGHGKKKMPFEYLVTKGKNRICTVLFKKGEQAFSDLLKEKSLITGLSKASGNARLKHPTTNQRTQKKPHPSEKGRDALSRRRAPAGRER